MKFLLKPLSLIACAIFFAGALHAQKPVLKFTSDKKFKIVQFTDVHIVPAKKESEEALKTMAVVLDQEKPQLVVFTGDVVTGKPVDKAWEMATAPVIERNIPFAVVFGNHDDENGWSREKMADLILELPGCLFVKKENEVYGCGNYVLEVKGSRGSDNAALLYCMDSNSYSKIEGVSGYGWFMADQINWYREQSKKLRTDNGKPLPALAFFHIALPEYREAYKNAKHPAYGIRLENECSPQINTGMFAAMLECGDVMGTFVGHDHINDYIAYLHGIALAYGRFTGGNTTYCELPNGGRVIELHEGKRSFKSWIRTGGNEVFFPVDFPDDFQPKK